jgi:hypothetical protein
MGSRPATTLSIPVLLRLGRVSNLPTVWSNVLAGVALAGGSLADPFILPVMLALSLFYTGGMFLNDAFDWKYDSATHPERPIPRQEITVNHVFFAGSLLLSGGVCLLAAVEIFSSREFSVNPVLAGLALAALIVMYNWHHKTNQFSPLLMGLCRLMVYVVAALSISHVFSSRVLIGGVVLVSWVIGLTYSAKQESLEHVANLWPLGFLLVPILFSFPLVLNNVVSVIVWALLLFIAVWGIQLIHRRKPGDVGQAVALMIAAISLLDALFVLHWSGLFPGILALACFPLTLLFHKFVAGT